MSNKECNAQKEKKMKSKRIRKADNLIHVVEVRSKPMLKVIKKCRKHIDYIGVPIEKDHYVYPEEAVYLLETCVGIISCDSKIYTQLDAFNMLERHSVNMNKYLTYSYLKKAGFVVVRQRNTRDEYEDDLPSIIPSTSSYSFPKHLLNSFPTMKKDVLIMQPLHRCHRLLPNGICIGQKESVHPDIIKTTSNASRSKNIRPLYWPSFPFSSYVQSWREYSQQKCFYLKLKLKHKSSTGCEDTVDYEVFLPNEYCHSRRNVKPIFSVICINGNESNINLKNYQMKAGNSELVLSIVHGGQVNLIESSGEGLDLNLYLSTLHSSNNTSFI